jgi:hypothetical protein
MSAQNPADAPVNQYTETPFDLRFYDANGNLIVAPNDSYFYDYRNPMTAAGAMGAYNAQSRYDALGRQIAWDFTWFDAEHETYVTQSEKYLYAPGSWQVIEERDDAGATLATYVYGNGLDEVLTMRRGGADYYYHADDMGNVVALSDEDGAVVERTEYEDFGRPLITDRNGAPTATSTVGNPYMFTGRRFDPATGFYDYRTRWMDPAAGA